MGADISRTDLSGETPGQMDPEDGWKPSAKLWPRGGGNTVAESDLAGSVSLFSYGPSKKPRGSAWHR